MQIVQDILFYFFLILQIVKVFKLLYDLPNKLYYFLNSNQLIY